MSEFAIWQQEPLLHSHYYWDKKEAFMLEVDVYEEWVLWVVESGSFQFAVDIEEGTATAGDLIFCPPHTSFHRSIISPCSFHFIRFYWRPIPGEMALSLRKMHITDEARFKSCCVHLRSEHMQLESEQLHHWKEHLLQDMWQMACLELAQVPAISGLTDDPQLEKARLYIEEHAVSELSLKALAVSIHLSPVQFTRKFKSAYGMNPIDYLTSIRIQKACSLLTETKEPLEWIAERCGYENGFYLSRVFARKMKMSPSEYRKTHRL
jgi:AraC family transcriptional regulator